MAATATAIATSTISAHALTRTAKAFVTLQMTKGVAGFATPKMRQRVPMQMMMSTTFAHGTRILVTPASANAL